MTLELKSEGRVSYSKLIPGRGGRRYQGPTAGKGLTWARNKKAASQLK
jgi:hypothetical protein